MPYLTTLRCLTSKISNGIWHPLRIWELIGLYSGVMHMNAKGGACERGFYKGPPFHSEVQFKAVFGLLSLPSALQSYPGPFPGIHFLPRSLPSSSDPRWPCISHSHLFSFNSPEGIWGSLFNLPGLPSSGIIPPHMECENITGEGLCISPPGLCAVALIHFTSTCFINSTLHCYFCSNSQISFTEM